MIYNNVTDANSNKPVIWLVTWPAFLCAPTAPMVLPFTAIRLSGLSAVPLLQHNMGLEGTLVGRAQEHCKCRKHLPSVFRNID